MAHCEYSMNISELVGKTFNEIRYVHGQVKFLGPDGNYRLYHSQDCCESVDLVEGEEELQDLVGSPILFAEEVSSDDLGFEPNRLYEYDECFEWTFYKIRTLTADVTLRWYGTSNGYYSTSVSFGKTDY